MDAAKRKTKVQRKPSADETHGNSEKENESDIPSEIAPVQKRRRNGPSGTEGHVDNHGREVCAVSPLAGFPSYFSMPGKTSSLAK